MISKLIMYSHGIETLWFFSRQMAEEFERLGYEVHFFDPDSDRYDEYLRLVEFINKAGHIASVGFNFSGCSGEECMYTEKGEHIYDKYHIPMIRNGSFKKAVSSRASFQ